MSIHQTKWALRLLIKHKVYKTRSLGAARALMECEQVMNVDIIWTRNVTISNVTRCFEKLIGKHKENLYEVNLVNNEILSLPPAISYEELHIPLFIEDV